MQQHVSLLAASGAAGFPCRFPLVTWSMMVGFGAQHAFDYIQRRRAGHRASMIEQQKHCIQNKKDCTGA